MLNRNIIGKHGELQQPIFCAVTGFWLGRNYVTVSIGRGWYIRYRASAQHLFTDEIVEKYKAMVALPKKKTVTVTERPIEETSTDGS